MKIGILSDTHGWLDPKIFYHFKRCQEVWHAGDIGDAILLGALNSFKCFRGVYGNIDGKEIRKVCPEFQEFQCEHLNVWMTHIGNTPPLYTPQIRTKLNQEIPDLLVCGHSHILRIMRDLKHPPLLYLNPGAAGRHGIHYMRTIIRCDISNKKISNIEVIELGRRAALTK